MKRSKLRPRERRVLRALAERERLCREVEDGRGANWIPLRDLAKALDVPVPDAAEVVRGMLARGLITSSEELNLADSRVSATELGRKAIA